MDRSIPSEIIEQWMAHLRRQRQRALEMIWLMERGATIHDGREGKPMHDVTARWLDEQKAVVADVDVLLQRYESINA